MDRGKRPGKFLNARNNKIYMDLKDIIREHALPYLPAKSLFRFQSVCRDWKLQIATPFFAHNQSISFRSVFGLFCQIPGEPPLFISYDPKSCGVPDSFLRFLPEPVVVRSSSNGLLCCQSCTGDRAYYICNPVTQQWKKLPKPNADHGSDPAIVLVFEPSLLNFVAEYKLVCAFSSNDFDDAIEFEVYSSVEGSWKTSGEICFASKNVLPSSGHQVNNVIYWKVKHAGVLAYDLAKDRSKLLQSYYSVNGTLGTLNGKLCTASLGGRTIQLYVLANVHSNTMQMNSNIRMWEERQHIILDSGVLGGDVCEAVVSVEGDVILVKSGKKIYSYDLKTKETKALSSLSSQGEPRFVPYVNSLVSI